MSQFFKNVFGVYRGKWKFFLSLINKYEFFYDGYLIKEFPCFRYQIAVGTSPGGGQVKAFYTIPAGNQHHTVSGLNLNGYRKVGAIISS